MKNCCIIWARRLTSVALCMVFGHLSAQEKNTHCFVSTVSKCGYTYIPSYIFKDSVEGVLYRTDTICTPREIVFSFYSIDIDGSYNLAVTPEQIFLYSSHDNPNSSSIYWGINIDSAQYKSIFNGLKKAGRIQLTNGASYYRVQFNKQQDVDFPSWSKNYEWTDKLTNYATLEKRHRLEQYFARMNKYLPSGTGKLTLPSQKELDLFDAKLMSSSRSELTDWLPLHRK